MIYMGSKRRLSKHILPIMLAKRKNEQWWVEPFVGGGNIIDKVNGNRLGADIDKYTIHALLSIRDHIDELPKNNKEFTEYDYNLLRLNDNYKHKGYAGYAFSFGAKWLGGWRRDLTGRDYVAEAFRSAIVQSKKLYGVHLICSSYDKLEIPNNSLIYCDPPYSNTTKYEHKIDHDKFFDWCRNKVNEGHTIFISEYDAPKDFVCIYSKHIESSLDVCEHKQGIEKLFIHESQRS